MPRRQVKRGGRKFQPEKPLLQCWFLWLNFLALQKRGARHLLIYNDRALSNGFGGVVFLDATPAA